MLADPTPPRGSDGVVDLLGVREVGARVADVAGQAFADEVEGTVNGLLRRIAEENQRARTKTGKIPPSTYTQLRAQYDQVLSRTGEFTRLLGRTEHRATAALELALDGLCDMHTRLDITPNGRPAA